MHLRSTPETLACSACGDDIADAGYLPATEQDDGYEPHADAAVCDACGFNDVGMMGCAPELDDVIDPGPDDVLLYVRRTDDGVDVVRVKE
jgi:hypothetical protein